MSDAFADEPATIALVGLGQMGASLGLALRAGGYEGRLIGYDHIAAHGAVATSMQAVDATYDQPEALAAIADAMVFCVPMRAYEPLMAQMAPHIRPGSIISDIGSVKHTAINRLALHLPAGCALVPSHPIAGSEQSGPEHARADFFSGKLFLITPPEHTPEPAVDQVARLWQRCGAQVGRMSAVTHDMVYATMSHLPQLAAYAAAVVLHESGIYPSSDDALFGRFIRISRSDPVMWRDIFLDNAEALLSALSCHEPLMTHMRDELMIGHGNRDTATPDATELRQLGTQLWPRLVASGLIVATQWTESQLGMKLARYAAGGFIDTTAPASVASDDADLEAASRYAPMLIAWLDRYIKQLNGLKALIGSGDEVALLAALSDCRQAGISLVTPRH